MEKQVCRTPYHHFEIFSSGDVFPCCPAYCRQYSLGNLLSQNMDDIWHGEKASLFRARLESGDYSNCELDVCTQYCRVSLSELQRKYFHEGRIGFPHTVVVSYDSECNLSCRICRASPHCNTADDIERNLKIESNFFPWLHDCKILALSGKGDPFGSRYCLGLIRRVRERWPHIKFDFITNGLCLTPNLYAKLGLEGRIAGLGISIHAATADVYRKVTRSGNFDRLMANLQFVGDLRSSGAIPALKFNFVVYDENYRDMPAFTRLAQKFHANVSFTTYQNRKHEALSSDYGSHAVFVPGHPLHPDFLNVLAQPCFNDGNIFLEGTLKRLRQKNNKKNIDAVYMSNGITENSDEKMEVKNPDIPVIETKALSIDLVDACNLACRTCFRGRYMKNNRGQIDLNLFESILKKAKFHDLQKIELFNWTEPFLCKNLYEYTKLVKDYGFYCEISSNLSLPEIPNFIEALRFVDHMRVSVSGFTQKTYSQNHRGGNIDFVKNNLRIIGNAIADGDITTRVFINYFDFPYTLTEYESFCDFAKSVGVKIIATRGARDPLSPSPIQKGFVPPPPAVGRRPVPQGPCEICGRCMPLDMRGDVFVCSAVGNSNLTRVGNFLRDDFDVLEYKRFSHPWCVNCEDAIAAEFTPAQKARMENGARKLLLRGPAVNCMDAARKDIIRAIEKCVQRKEGASTLADMVNQDWYYKKYPDVEEAGMNAAYHYFKYGWKENRNPTSWFDTRYYLRKYGSELGVMNPFIHFIIKGLGEGKKPNQDFIPPDL